MKEVNGRKYFDWEDPIKPSDLEILRVLPKITDIGFMEKRDPIVLLYTNADGIEFLVCDLGQYLVKRYPSNIMASATYGKSIITVIEVDWDRNKFSYTDFLGMFADPDNKESDNYIENLFHLYEL